MRQNRNIGGTDGEAVVRKFADCVYKLAYARTGSKQDAEDVFQTTFERLFKSGKSFADDEHLKAWLIRVCINACNDLAKSAWKKRVGALEDSSDSFESNSNGAQSEAIDKALETLSPVQRSAIHLFYYEGYSTEEIAAMTNEKPATVRSHLHRARIALKEALELQRSSS